MSLRIASVCKALPNPDSIASGAFVMRRLEAMCDLADVKIIQPIPYFPVVRPLPTWGRADSHAVGCRVVHHAPMLYFPGVLKHLDGRFLERAIVRRLGAVGDGRAFDLLDAHFGYPDGVGAVRAAERLRMPSFVTIRGLETDYLLDPQIGPQLAASLKRASGCISVSHTLRNLVLGHGVPPEHVRVIPNAVDRSVFHLGDKASARARLQIASSPPLIVSVGTMIELKRHHIAIRALAEVRKKWPAIMLAIIGMHRDEPSYLPQLQRLVGELGLENAVRFVGGIAPGEVAHWLIAADAFCLVSSREGCCNAVLEALACGRPVVTTPVGDNSHYVVDGANGHLVPVDDVAATAKALADVLTSGRWDANRISADLPIGTWGDVAKRVIEFFEERLASSGGGAVVGVAGA